MSTPADRIDARQAHEHLQQGTAMLICAYDDNEKFRQNHLEGAISLDEFRSQAASIPQDRELVFYCA